MSIVSLLARATASLAFAAVTATHALGAEPTRYRTVPVGDTQVFAREAGPSDAPAVLLLHGFGASSYMFRDLIPALSDRYRVIAPDLPGFGLTEAPPRGKFTYDFDHLADVIDRFAEAEHLERYAIYVFDYGAPVGWRLALRHPDRITAIVTQNGNAYEEGFSQAWAPIRKTWTDPSPANRDALRPFVTLATTRWQYEEGTRDKTRLAPDAWVLAQAGFDRPGNVEIQLDLFENYKTNLQLYPALQAYLRDRKPPLLAIWGKNDPFFLPAGAQAFTRDDPRAEVVLIDAGHMALESSGAEIAPRIRAFLDANLPR